MKCPICKTVEIEPSNLESGLASFECPQCKGDWIQGNVYWKWIEEKGANLPEKSSEDHAQFKEREEPKDCPECRWRMNRYRVGRGLSFSLDHCHACKGIWLDGNEWEALQDRNLHDDLHSMLTDFWQSRARQEEQRRRMEHIYRTKFGDSDFERILQVRQWLDGHVKKAELLGYLTDKDPNSVW